MTKILVVDDDANVQRLLRVTLKQDGYEVVVAGDGAEGLRLWETESPSLILLDVTLAKLDGYEVATKIREAELLARMKSLLARFSTREGPGGIRAPMGKLLAFYGAKGGVGTTTLAINAAIALHQEHTRRGALAQGAPRLRD